MLFKRKECSKCHKKIGLFENRGTDAEPLCFDCGKVSGRSDTVPQDAVDEKSIPNQLISFFKEARGNAEATIEHLKNSEYWKVIKESSDFPDFSAMDNQTWIGPLKWKIASGTYNLFTKSPIIPAAFKIPTAAPCKNADQDFNEQKPENDEEIKSLIAKEEKLEWFTNDHGIFHPDWKIISKWVWSAAEEYDVDKLWYHVAIKWFEMLCRTLGDRFYVYQSNNFFVFSAQKDSYVEGLSRFLETTLSTIQKALSGIAREKWSGRFVALVLNDPDQYYQYISHYYKEGTFGKSSGVYLNRGYGHFVFPFQDIRESESIVAHELAHACVNHLRPPAWLNEALAMSVQRIAIGMKPLDGDLITRDDHLKYWKKLKEFWMANSMNDFWSGESFHRSDEGQRYSYSFADALFNMICDRYGNHREFVLHSSSYDAGNSAAQCLYGENLGEIVSSMIGVGNWTPSMDLILKRFKE